MNFNYDSKDSISDLILEFWWHQQREKLCTNPEKTMGMEETKKKTQTAENGIANNGAEKDKRYKYY